VGPSESRHDLAGWDSQHRPDDSLRGVIVARWWSGDAWIDATAGTISMLLERTPCPSEPGSARIWLGGESFQDTARRDEWQRGRASAHC